MHFLSSKYDILESIKDDGNYKHIPSSPSKPFSASSNNVLKDTLDEMVSNGLLKCDKKSKGFIFKENYYIYSITKKGRKKLKKNKI